MNIENGINSKNRIYKKVIASVLILSVLSSVVLVYDIKKDVAKDAVITYKDKKIEKKGYKGGKEEIEFEYNSSSIEACSAHLVNKATYKTEYFKEDSTKYNHELAQLSLAMAMASGSTSECEVNWGDMVKKVVDTETRKKNIDVSVDRNAYMVDVYKKLDFYNDIYEKYDVSLNDDSDTIAYSLAMKDIKIDNKEYTLLVCNARSNSYGAEWASNLTMYNEDGITGFQAAGEEFYKGIKKYIKKHKLGKNTKVWLPGFSRGGAAANVATALLDKDIEAGKYEFSREDVYAYIFATPQATLDKDYDNKIYNNIFNIVNEADIVPKVAPSCWGFKRYGKEIEIPQICVTKRQLDRIEKGKRVKLDKEKITLIKNVSYEYNKIRYANMLYPEDRNLKSLYVGFTVDEDFPKMADVICGSLADDAKEYSDKYQGLVKEIMPFISTHSKTYSEKKGEWIPYDNLADYLSTKYGDDVFDEVSKEGLISKKEYYDILESIETMHRLRLINSEVASSLNYIVDNYYGINIIAYKYGVDVDFIKEFMGALFKDAWDDIYIMNVNDPFNCQYVHYAEFYMAWMRNYNPYTQEIIK